MTSLTIRRGLLRYFSEYIGIGLLNFIDMHVYRFIAYFYYHINLKREACQLSSVCVVINAVMVFAFFQFKLLEK